MGFNCGIVGLPNVGKSTLFNALTATAAAAAANFPFCTIEPNVGRVPVPDRRLATIAELSNSAKVIPTQLEFVDIAGLVAGASRGEGLGNQFLAHIREVDAIIHVLRCFADDNVVHVAGGIDPLRDAEIVETELMLADLDSLERRIQALVKRARGNDAEARGALALADQALEALKAGQPARTVEVADEEAKAFKGLQLLTAKPVLYVCNVAEEEAAEGNAASAAVAARAAELGAEAVVVSAGIEAELVSLPEADRGCRNRARPGHPRRLPAPRPDHLFHRRAEGVAGLDGAPGSQGAGGRGRDPQRLPARLHPRRDHELRRPRRVRSRAEGARRRQDALRGPARRRQNALRGPRLYGRRRRHHAVPLQRVAAQLKSIDRDARGLQVAGAVPAPVLGEMQARAYLLV